MELREAYQKKASAQLREWRRWIDQFKNDPGFFAARSTGEHLRLGERLDNFHQTACDRLQDLSAAPETVWDLKKQAVERAMIDLKLALDESGAAQQAAMVQLHVGREHAYEPFYRKG